MHDFKRTGVDTFEFKIDQNIYSDEVISKVLYWLAAEFIIERHGVSQQIQHIRFKRKSGATSDEELLKYETTIAQMFSDFKVREIVRKETEGIRNILYLKAFANCSDLEDLRGDR